jgi:hypothetical protein
MASDTFSSSTLFTRQWPSRSICRKLLGQLNYYQLLKEGSAQCNSCIRDYARFHIINTCYDDRNAL